MARSSTYFRCGGAAPVVGRVLLLSVIIFTLLVSCHAVHASATIRHHSADGVGTSSYRCFRPFDALSSFKPASMRSRDNCQFDFVEIRNASVEVSCTSEDDEAAQTTAGCYATMRVEMYMTPQVVLDHMVDPISGAELVEVEAVVPRFTVELRAVNYSTVSYKGFDGVGYDVCCSLLDAEYAQCEWTTSATTSTLKANDAHSKDAEEHPVKSSSRRNRISCALLDRSRVGSNITGSIRKPLHRLVEGAWEMKLVLYRGRTAVGRLIVPFHVSKEDIQRAVLTTTNEIEDRDAAKLAADHHHHHHDPHHFAEAAAVVVANATVDEQ